MARRKRNRLKWSLLHKGWRLVAPLAIRISPSNLSWCGGEGKTFRPVHPREAPDIQRIRGERGPSGITKPPMRLSLASCKPLASRSRQRRPSVYLRDRGEHVVRGRAKAIEWFADPYWHGPKPQPDTIYEVSLVSDGREWQVPAEKIERWLARRARSSANLES
jgi:hypothetical protein